MKKFLSILLTFALILSMAALLISCGEADTSDTETSADVETTANDTETEAESESESESESEAAAPIKEGTIDISGLVSVELKDGWYSEKGLDTTWNEIELINDSIDDFMAYVSVKVCKVYEEGEHAKEWADTINGNYGGGGTVIEEEINGVSYYHLSGVTDDDTQNLYFTDLDDGHYLEVSVMFMPVEKGLPVFNLITFNNK